MLVLGHQGASLIHPGNSLAAFSAALDQGADGVELDVRRTADGALVCSHDPHLADGRALLDLAAVDLPPEVPTLAAALELLAPARIVNVEIKNWPDEPDYDAALGIADEVVRLLEARGELDDGRILVSAFHLPTLDRVHERAPGLPTAWLLLDARDPAALIDKAAARGHRAIHPHHVFVSDEVVARAHGAGLAVNAWTCDDPDRIRWLRDVGVDGVVTNDPALALRALATGSGT